MLQHECHALVKRMSDGYITVTDQYNSTESQTKGRGTVRDRRRDSVTSDIRLTFESQAQYDK